ncbi:MAG: hypothetical protein APF82_11015 [Sphingomonadales bacterium BRH_c42]|nr:MAG: hypothetical protein APF82_11015 [Sphingomonadales bacterium BRH_c42]
MRGRTIHNQSNSRSPLVGCKWITVLLSSWLLLAACNPFDDTPTYRYRMTVEVDTPEGLKTGSSVIEVDTHMETNPESPSSQRINRSAMGEAAMVDLGERGILFALLRSEDDVDFAARIMFLLAPKGLDKNGDAFLGRFANMLELTEPVELPATQEKINPPLAKMKGRPMLVTFGDLVDPASVERVDPDDLAATFGKGVSLRRITVQITRDRVTTGIEKRLGWLSQLKGMNLSRSDFPDDVPVGAFSEMFRKGN